MVNFQLMVRRRRLVTPVALGTLLFAPVAVAQQSPPDYTALFASYGKKTVQAKLGGYCHPTADGSGVCGGEYTRDGMGTITVRRDADLTLLVRHPATSVEWQAMRIDGRGDEQIVAHGSAKAVTRTLKRWKLRVPRNLTRSTDVLRFNVRYPYAFSSFGVLAKVLKAAPKKQSTTSKSSRSR